MTRTAQVRMRTDWMPADPPGVAAPLLAVEQWQQEWRGDGLELTARVRVRGDEPNLRGHFPGKPVFPGVFVIEAMCQTVALATPLRLRTLRSVRFLAPLLDGDELTLSITVTQQPASSWTVTARGTNLAGETTAKITAEFVAQFDACACGGDCSCGDDHA